MFRSFTDTFTIRSRESLHCFLVKCCLYAYGLPALVVILTVSIHVALKGPSDIGYGGGAAIYILHS